MFVFFAGVFIICWLPFFLTHVLKAHCGSCCISPSLYSAVTWLGYLNSAVNPVIYTTFNIEFRKAFIKILHCWQTTGEFTEQKKLVTDKGNIWSSVCNDNTDQEKQWQQIKDETFEKAKSLCLWNWFSETVAIGKGFVFIAVCHSKVNILSPFALPCVQTHIILVLLWNANKDVVLNGEPLWFV